MNDQASTETKENQQPDWRNNGLRIIRGGELDSNTPQTPGMNRAEAISYAKVGRRNCGRERLWYIPTPRLDRIITENWRR